MAVMALAMAVTANVQPTLNHGVRTAGHPAMEETLAPTVEGHQATEETLAPTAEDHPATEETPMATVNPLAMEAMVLALAMPTMEEERALSTALAAKEDAGAMVETAMVVAGQLHVTAATSLVTVVVATATMVAPPQTMGGELLRPQQKICLSHNHVLPSIPNFTKKIQYVLNKTQKK